MLRKKYEGKIDDNLLNQILIDDNPARIAEVTATIDEALIMQHKGMGPETIMQTFKDAWKRKKQASGGLAGMLGE
jgi:predicted acetyltransferase